MQKDTSTDGEKKYNLLKQLNALSTTESRIAKSKLPIALNVSTRTFERWLYITHKDSLQIPCGKLAILGKFFGCSMEELLNYKVPKYSIYKLKQLRKTNPSILKSFNLSK